MSHPKQRSWRLSLKPQRGKRAGRGCEERSGRHCLRGSKWKERWPGNSCGSTSVARPRARLTLDSIAYLWGSLGKRRSSTWRCPPWLVSLSGPRSSPVAQGLLAHCGRKSSVFSFLRLHCLGAFFRKPLNISSLFFCYLY